MEQHVPCELFLVRYVPDVVKGEFINIGVLLRPALPSSLSVASASATTLVRFTRNWARVRGIDPDADLAMLEALEEEIAAVLLSEAASTKPSRPLLSLLSDTLSNSIQITEPRACLAENLTLELDRLMQLYVESLRVELTFTD